MALSHTNERTGLPNYRAFTEYITAELNRGRRYGHSLGLIMLDFDGFKTINSLLNQLGADELLREFAKFAPAVLREFERIFHISGDEFMIVLPEAEMDDVVTVLERIDRVVANLSEDYQSQLKGFRFSATHSVVIYKPTQDIEGVLVTPEELYGTLSQKNLAKKKLHKSTKEQTN